MIQKLAKITIKDIEKKVASTLWRPEMISYKMLLQKLLQTKNNKKWYNMHTQSKNNKQKNTTTTQLSFTHTEWKIKMLLLMLWFKVETKCSLYENTLFAVYICNQELSWIQILAFFLSSEQSSLKSVRYSYFLYLILLMFWNVETNNNIIFLILNEKFMKSMVEAFLMMNFFENFVDVTVQTLF